MESVAGADKQPVGVPTEVLVIRPLDGLMRGLDPVEMRAEVLGNQVVKNMVEGTRIEIRTARGLWRSPP